MDLEETGVLRHEEGVMADWAGNFSGSRAGVLSSYLAWMQSLSAVRCADTRCFRAVRRDIFLVLLLPHDSR